MSKNKTLIVAGIFIVLNLITWMIWGRDGTLALSVGQFRTAATCFVDTVHVFAGENPQTPSSISQYNDYSEKAHKHFENAFEYKTFSLNIYLETYEEGRAKIPEYLDYENAIFEFGIFRAIPFYSKIETQVIAGDGSADVTGYYLWLFRWWKIA